MSNNNAHDFHLVDTSPWPTVGAIGALTITFGTVLYMHSFALGNIVLPFGIFMVIFTMIFWWRDVTKEGTMGGFHTMCVQVGLRNGMILFIISELMFFFAFFWAFFSIAAAPASELGAMWPPIGIKTLNAFHIPLINTAILILSGFTVTVSHFSITATMRNIAGVFLGITVLLGIIFTALQLLEYTEANFNISDSSYGSTFYMATGFHGFHVFIGTTFLTICLYREIEYHFTMHHHFGLEGAAWYWQCD